MTVLEHHPIGVPIHGQHNSTDATAGVRLVLTAPKSSTPHALVTIGTSERLAVTHATMMAAGADDATVIFFDNESLTSAEAQVSVSNNGGNPDTFTMAGDFADEFRVGRLFTVANSANNNGQYTVTAVAFAAGVTTVSVATGSWTDEDEGDVTANPTTTEGMNIAQGEITAIQTREVADFSVASPRFGPVGYTVYGQTASAVDETDFLFDGFVQTPVTKTGPIAPQARA